MRWSITVTVETVQTKEVVVIAPTEELAIAGGVDSVRRDAWLAGLEVTEISGTAEKLT